MVTWSCKSCVVVVVVLVFSIVLNISHQSLCGADPTDGFIRVTLTGDDLVLQKPYDEATEKRYSSHNGVERFRVFTNDKPFKQGSPTRPRTEIRIRGHDYSSGVWQFEGNAYVPKGTSGVTIMQVFGSGGSEATTLQLRIYNGELRIYNSKLVASDIYDRWFRVNVIHDVDQGKLTVFFDGVQKLVADGRGKATFYFKYGVYAAAPHDSSNYMESRWKGIKIFKK